MYLLLVLNKYQLYCHWIESHKASNTQSTLLMTRTLTTADSASSGVRVTQSRLLVEFLLLNLCVDHRLLFELLLVIIPLVSSILS